MYRLNQNARFLLRAFARETLVCTDEQATEDIAFARLQATIDRIFAEVAPESDMAVLRKHHAVCTEDHLNLTLAPEDGAEPTVVELCFCPRNPAQGRGLRHRRCRHPRGERVLREMPSWFQGWARAGRLSTSHLSPDLAQEVLSAYRAYADAVKAHDDARDVVIRAVDYLIEANRTLEALIKVWPLAEQARERLGAEAARIVSGAAFVVQPTTAEGCGTETIQCPDPA